jgi:hypothetical protein
VGLCVVQCLNREAPFGDLDEDLKLLAHDRAVRDDDLATVHLVEHVLVNILLDLEVRIVLRGGVAVIGVKTALRDKDLLPLVLLGLLDLFSEGHQIGASSDLQLFLADVLVAVRGRLKRQSGHGQCRDHLRVGVARVDEVRGEEAASFTNLVLATGLGRVLDEVDPEGVERDERGAVGLRGLVVVLPLNVVLRLLQLRKSLFEPLSLLHIALIEELGIAGPLEIDCWVLPCFQRTNPSSYHP